MPEDLKYWTISAEKCLSTLGVSKESGLFNAEVLRRQKKYGKNKLKEPKPKSGWFILFEQFKSLIVVLLGIAVTLSFLFHEYVEGWAIFVVIFINALIGFFTEIRAVRSMEALRKLEQVDARILRNGDDYTVAAQELVPGDIVLLEGGDIVPADIRLVEASKLQVDESPLTGESLPVEKDIKPLAESTPLAERINMLYKGTAITRGSAIGVVVATGALTELGIISALVEEAEEEMTPLEKRLDQLGQKLIWLTLVLTAIIAVLGIFRGKEIFLMIETAIALAVAAIPEGLPIVATIALARGMLRMAKKNALIRQLSSVETLGATNVICTDKTGTLTENRMSVSQVIISGGSIFADKHGFLLNEKKVEPQSNPNLEELLRACVLCNNASIAEGYKNIGDPLEIALLAAGSLAGLGKKELQAKYPRIREDAFDSESKMMATFHQDGKQIYVAAKGAPESILKHCSQIKSDGKVKAMTSQEREYWCKKNEKMAEDGLRVIAVAGKKTNSENEKSYENQIFLGLVGLMDPPRADVRDAIDKCHDAGIRVIMITGDQAVTAAKIGKSVGIDDDPIVLPGSVLFPVEELSAEEKQKIIDTSIFARVSPKQKLDLISIHQSNNSIVAMTGDGVNDAPALKKADIGIAMGMRGTQVAREASNMVLKDDAFSTIVAAIEQGRVIFKNIRKFVVFLLSCNLCEILTIATASMVNGPMPILPLQILFLNLVTDIFPALALGVGREDKNVMNDKPRDPQEPIVTGILWWKISLYSVFISAAVLGALAISLGIFKMETEKAVTISFLTLAFAQLWHVFNMSETGSPYFRNEITQNPWIWGALVLCTLLLIGATLITPLASILHISAPGTDGWIIVVGMSLAPLLLGQIVKMVNRFRAA
ncbi:cation-transporting P-type ATPase [candidate division KSB1 bacterium]|nr:cation-transporting P-type ATPase [candidate division KSB1 bacterium]